MNGLEDRPGSSGYLRARCRVFLRRGSNLRPRRNERKRRRNPALLGGVIYPNGSDVMGWTRVTPAKIEAWTTGMAMETN